MAKNVYLVIPDLHLGNLVTNNRKSYRDEMIAAEMELLKIAIHYKQENYNVITMFLGDIFHNSYKDVTEALIDKDFISNWRLKVGEVYTVMGNHEFTYYRANPFYTLIHSIESESVRRISNRVYTPLGTTNVVRVIDNLTDGEVSFYFNHFGTGIAPTDNKVNIGLFHQELVDPQIRAEMENKLGKQIYSKVTDLDNSQILSQYTYCFFGHMHTIYGVWKSGNTYLSYLGSLGRTNETEVRNDFLERNVPAIIVNDGIFERIEDNFFNLLSRGESVVEEVVTRVRKEREVTAELKELRSYVPLNDSPIKNVRTLFAEEPQVLRILDDLKNSDLDSRMLNIKTKMEVCRVGNY